MNSNGVYYLRLVDNKDEDLLLNWANDLMVRKNSFCQAQIKPEEHKKWFHNALKDESVIIYILMKKNEPIGQCRLNIDGNTAYINYSIEENMRGQGFGKMILDLMEREVRTNHSQIKRLVAKVKVENEASRRCFEKCDYIEAYQVFEKSI